MPEYEASGMSVGAFSKLKGIPYAALYQRIKLHKKRAEKVGKSYIVESPATLRSKPRLDAPEVRYDDCRLVQAIEREFWINNPQIGRLELVDHQRRVLNEMFREQADGRLKYSTYIYSCPKKSGKTAIGSALTQAFALHYGGEMYSIANDAEGAKNRMFERVVQSLRLMREHDPKTFDKIMPDDKKIRERIAINGVIEFADCGQVNPGPHQLRYIAQDAAGEAGSMMACCVFDELWGVSSERGERLWSEFQPIPVIPVSIRLVTTYAGFYGESALLWRIYENVCKPNVNTNEEEGNRVPGLEDLPVFVSDDGSTIVYWDHEARMPWHTPEFLAQAKNDPSVQGRESEYRRLWHNEWSSGVEAFIDMEHVDRAIAIGREKGMFNRMSRQVLGV